MDKDKAKETYIGLLNELQDLCDRAQFAIDREQETLRKKVALVAVLVCISAAALGISIWQLAIRGVNSAASGSLLFATIMLFGVTVLLCSIMISDIRQHHHRIATILDKVNKQKKILEDSYKNTIKDL